MYRKEYLYQSVEIIDLNDKTLDILKENKIYTIENLWHLKRKDLKEMKITESEINKIIITLELQGMDLNSKIYEK